MLRPQLIYASRMVSWHRLWVSLQTGTAEATMILQLDYGQKFHLGHGDGAPLVWVIVSGVDALRHNAKTVSIYARLYEHLHGTGRAQHRMHVQKKQCSAVHSLA